MINGDLGFDRDGEADTHSIHCLRHIPPYPRGSVYANASYKTSMTYNLDAISNDCLRIISGLHFHTDQCDVALAQAAPILPPERYPRLRQR